MQTITAAKLYALAQQHSLPDRAVLTLPAPGRAVKPDCVAMCAENLEAFAGALGVTVVHTSRRRKGERPDAPLSFDEPAAPLAFEGDGQ